MMFIFISYIFKFKSNINFGIHFSNYLKPNFILENGKLTRSITFFNSNYKYLIDKYFKNK